MLFLKGSLLKDLISPAAVSAVGIRYLADPGVRSLGIIGAGTQAFYQAIMASQVRSFDRVYISDLDRSRAEKLASSLATELDAEMIIAATNEELVIASEVVITATTSFHPVITSDKEILSGKTFVGIGSFKPTMREIPEELFHLVDRVYVDSQQATSFFKSVGMALFDLLVAEKIYGLARKQGAGIEIDIS